MIFEDFGWTFPLLLCARAFLSTQIPFVSRGFRVLLSIITFPSVMLALLSFLWPLTKSCTPLDWTRVAGEVTLWVTLKRTRSRRTSWQL